MIFEGQDHIHQSINGINKRLNEIVGLSQQVSNQVSQISSGAVAAPQVCSMSAISSTAFLTRLLFSKMLLLSTSVFSLFSDC